MKLTFAIPFYSTPEYLDSAIRSVIAQTHTDWELIVIDDRSPHKGIEEQVKGYGDPRISYQLNPQNLGQAGNWNRCLEAATSEMVTILHADDELQPAYAATILNAAERFPDASAVFCNADIIDESGKKLFSFADFYKRFIIPMKDGVISLSGEEGLRALIRGNFIMCPTLCYRRSRLGALRFSPDFKCAPDLDFTSRLLAEGGRLVGISDVAFSYRRHGESGTAEFRRSLQQFDEEIRLYDLIGERAEKVGWKTAASEARRKRIVKLRLGYFGLKDLLTLRFKASLNKFLLIFKLLGSNPGYTA